MESAIYEQPVHKTSGRGRLKRVLIHGLAGAIAGYLILHPLSMFIHLEFHQLETGRIGFLIHSFTVRHLDMAVYFAGLVQGMYVHKLKILYEEARVLSLIDELTSLYNRRHFIEELGRELERTRRYEKPFCLMIIDIDHFKRYNDTYGHQAGDGLLREFAKLVKAAVRRADVAGRYGGDEFVVVMPETTEAAAHRIAERLRCATQEHTFPENETRPSGKVTASIGIAEFASDGRDLQQLVKEADAALYRAKELGRNRVCLANKRDMAMDGSRH